MNDVNLFIASTDMELGELLDLASYERIRELSHKYYLRNLETQAIIFGRFLLSRSNNREQGQSN